MKRMFFALGAALVLCTACEPQEALYRFEEFSFRYDPAKYSIVQESSIPGGVHLVMRNEGTQRMEIDIINLGDDIEDLPLEERQQIVAAEADRMFAELKRNPSYDLTPTEPLNQNLTIDRWTGPDEKPFSEWDILFCKKDGQTVSTLIHVGMVENYEVRLFLESSKPEDRDIVTIGWTFRADD